VVFEARRRVDGHRVALKCLHSQLEHDTKLVEMFEREARIASFVRHPAVCRVFEHGVVEGSHYIAMELLDGVALDRLLRQLPADPCAADPHYAWIAARILASLCRGLHAAHRATDEAGVPLAIVHRDVSPQNLYVLVDGSVRVIDFGIARSTLANRKTTGGVVKGRLAYVAPEHLMNHPIDLRADVWAIGVVAWELLVGRRLFRRHSLGETVDALLRSKIPTPSTVAPHVPAALDQVVIQALSREPSGRHGSMEAMADALDESIASHAGVVRRAEIAHFVARHFPPD
jgi:serine/threonine protein kinase